MTEIGKYVILKQILKKHGAKKLPKYNNNIEMLINDIMLDINELGEVLTERIYKVLTSTFVIDDSSSKSVMKEFAEWCKKNNVTEEYTIIEQTARPPKLKGRAEKARQAKAEIMAMISKSDSVSRAKDKLFLVIQREAIKAAKELGINPNIINLDKITIKR